MTFPLVGSTFQVTVHHELDRSSWLVNIFRPPRSSHMHSPTDISFSQVDFSSYGSPRTREVVMTHQHFYVVRLTASATFTQAWFFQELSPNEVSNSRVDFLSDGWSQTGRVVMTHQHFQVSSPPPLSQVPVTSTSATSANTTTWLPLNRLSSPKSWPDWIRLYWTKLSFDPLKCKDHIVLAISYRLWGVIFQAVQNQFLLVVTLEKGNQQDLQIFFLLGIEWVELLGLSVYFTYEYLLTYSPGALSLHFTEANVTKQVKRLHLYNCKVSVHSKNESHSRLSP